MIRGGVLSRSCVVRLTLLCRIVEVVDNNKLWDIDEYVAAYVMMFMM
ncbi:hypothetical protein MtrunA17_Chr4g0019641 [Medicago truncatula]|uniref:Uncharacterized protein n=1 Tax=Medicago truncatula TaxID=3880 RepID=A0A396I2X4_MEDTR|nr:hypothetical protein MtrunA17_Chr4g0019641 [Medicago truncatula]